MPPRLEQVTEDRKKKFLHMKEFQACESKAFVTGCFTYMAAFTTVYLAQELLRTKLPYGRKNFLLLPVAVGTASAYAMTWHNTRVCRDMWLALEENDSLRNKSSESSNWPPSST